MKIFEVNDAVFLYMSELGAKVVAETGKPSDRYHLGKLILKIFRSYPEWTLQLEKYGSYDVGVEHFFSHLDEGFFMGPKTDSHSSKWSTALLNYQRKLGGARTNIVVYGRFGRLPIDANTESNESSKSVLSRSIRCAYSMQQRLLSVGDVIVLMAPNHLDQCIPFYAANYLGLIIYPIDINLKKEEIIHFLRIGKPKLIFCQNIRADDVNAALKSLDMPAEIITYDDSTNYKNFLQFISESPKELKEDDFQATDLDPESTITYLIPTSGTTGLPKATATSYMNLGISLPYFWVHNTDFFPNTTRGLVVSTLQWFSGLLQYFSSALFAYTRIQTSAPFSVEHYHYIFNVYKPNYLFMSPNLMSLLLKDADETKCDFSSVKYVCLGGSAVSEELMIKTRQIIQNSVVCRVYGMSELSGYAFLPCEFPPHSIGRLLGQFQAKLVVPETESEILEPFKNGELLLKGPTIFKGYFNGDDATKDTFSKDGIWFKTGDLMYFDEYGFYYYVDRIKILLKYRNHQISPLEIEEVIRRHRGVMDVAVTGIQDEDLNDLPVACVVKHTNANVTAQEIKDLVDETLTESKQLRGGVIFMQKLPMTVSMKVDRKKLKKIVLESLRE